MRIAEEYDKALEAFSNALQVQPQFVQVYLARGDVFLLQGQSDTALAEYKAGPARGSHVCPGPGENGRRSTRATNSQRKPRKPIAAAIDLDPKQTIAYNSLAWMAAERQTQLDEAITWAQESRRTRTQNAPDSRTRSDGSIGPVGNSTRRPAVLQKATTMQPPQAAIWYHLGLVQAERKKTKEAVAAMQQSPETPAVFPGH